MAKILKGQADLREAAITSRGNIIPEKLKADPPATPEVKSVESAPEAAIGVEQSQEVRIGVDRTDAQILNLNIDKGIKLVWNEHDFRALPAAVVDQLRGDNLREYIRAETRFLDAKKAKEAEAVYVGPRRLLDPLGMNAENRMSSQEPKRYLKAGWHLYWAAPGADYESKMASGHYRPVRKMGKRMIGEVLTVETEENTDLFEESGELTELMDADGKVELILLAVREELFREHLEWMSQASREQYQQGEANFREGIERINRDLPNRKDAVQVISGSH